jgi:hypothetical protein
MISARHRHTQRPHHALEMAAPGHASCSRTFVFAAVVASLQKRCFRAPAECRSVRLAQGQTEEPRGAQWKQPQ